MIRYKLTQSGLEWDNYSYALNAQGNTAPNRTEMEMAQLPNGNYRLAIPIANQTVNPVHGIEILDLNSSFEVISTQDIDLGNDANGVANIPNGLEFDPTGRYLYLTHQSNANLSGTFHVWDVNSNNWISCSPTLAGINNFEKSYIERYGDKMYVVDANHIGEFSNISTPCSLTFNSNAVNLGLPSGSEYGNNTVSNDPADLFGAYEMWKYILPDQVDAGNYGDLADRSCDCCKRWHVDLDKYAATGTATWSPGSGSNPFNSIDGNVYIREELRIKAGANITISNMNFYFGKDAVAVVERKDGSTAPAYLKLTNGTVFTADLSCSDESIPSCEDNEICEKDRWKGVRVEGDDTDHTQSTSKQARFYMDGGSMIEYAKTGIWVGHHSMEYYGGGIISIKNSTLKDNITGIRFDPFIRSTTGGAELYNKAIVSNNEFRTTVDWFDDGYYPLYFVDVKSSSGLYLRGNIYENSDPDNNGANRGIGIRTVDSRIDIGEYCSGTSNPCAPQDIVRSEFTNLFYGIYGMNSNTTTRTIYANYNVFNKNFYGTFLTDFINPFILDNDFYVQNGVYGATGLAMNASTGYYIQNNNFRTYDSKTPGYNVGVLIDNSGPTDNFVYRNHFTTLSFAGIAQNENADGSDNDQGLHWICNQFAKPILTADIYLNGTMSDEQGKCSTMPAGNLFSKSSTLGGAYTWHFDLQATTGSTTNIIYTHHNSATPYPIIPLAYNTSYYQLAECVPVYYTTESCPIDKSGAPDGVDHELGKSNNTDILTFAAVNNQASEFQSQITALENQLDGGNTAEILAMIQNGGSADEIAALLNQAGGNISTAVQNALSNSGNSDISALVNTDGNDVSDIENELRYIQTLNNELWNSAVNSYMADTTGTISSEAMQSLLSTYTPDNIQRFASIILPEGEQDWIDSENKSDQLVTFTGTLPILTEDGLPTDIPEWFESDFFASATNASALNSLYIANGAIYNPHIYGVEWGELSDENKSLNGDSDQDNASKLVVHPNPFKETVQFDLSAYSIKGNDNRIEFYDILGKRVYTDYLKEDQLNATIQAANLPEGVVLYKLFLNNQAIETGKIIRVK